MPATQRRLVPMHSPVPSPCVNTCRMQPDTGWCEGCMRTIDEIAQWSVYDNAQKRAVWALLAARAALPRTTIEASDE